MNTFSLLFLLLISISNVHSYCAQNSDCEHGGECHNSKCECPAIRWAGEHCEVRTEAYLGARYDGYYYTILLITWILFSACAAKLWFVYQANRRHSMVHLAVWMLTVAMLLRGVNYITEVDGHFYRNDSLEPFSGLCFYLFYPLVLSAYLCELFLWMELYRAATHTKIENLPRYRKVFFGINAVMFPLELVTRIAVNIYQDTSTAVIFTAVYACYIGLVLLLETIGFITVAVLVLKRLSQVRAITGHEQSRKTFIRVSLVLICLAVLLVMGLAVIFYFFLATNIEVYYGLLWFSRIVEYAIVTGLLVVLRAPRDDHGSSHEMSGSAVTISRSSTTPTIDLV